MKHDSLIKFLTFAFDQRVNNNNPISPIIWSQTGLGKTAGVGQFASSIGAKLIKLHLSSQEPGDLIGLPSRVNGKTVNLRPEWFPDENSEEKHVIFLDEFNRAHKSVLDVMLPFLLEGEIHSHKVPKNTLIVAAANPDDGENYNVTSIDDKALISRLCHVVLNNDYKSWKRYCGDQVHPAVLETAQKMTFGGRCDLPKKDPDPRSMFIVGKALKHMTEEQYDDFGLEFLIGMVGSFGQAINNHIKDQGLNKFSVTPEDVIKNYKTKSREKVLKEISNLPAIAELSTGVVDILTSGKDVPPRGISNVTIFMNDLPAEILVAFMVAFLKGLKTEDDTQREKVANVLDKISEEADKNLPELMNKVGINNINTGIKSE